MNNGRGVSKKPSLRADGAASHHLSRKQPFHSVCSIGLAPPPTPSPSLPRSLSAVQPHNVLWKSSNQGILRGFTNCRPSFDAIGLQALLLDMILVLNNAIWAQPLLHGKLTLQFPVTCQTFNWACVSNTARHLRTVWECNVISGAPEIQTTSVSNHQSSGEATSASLHLYEQTRCCDWWAEKLA